MVVVVKFQAIYGKGKMFALILNIETDREGAEKDVLSLVEAFTRCGFDINVCQNWKKEVQFAF